MHAFDLCAVVCTCVRVGMSGCVCVRVHVSVCVGLSVHELVCVNKGSLKGSGDGTKSEQAPAMDQPMCYKRVILVCR